MIYLGADHKGFQLKEEIKIFLKNKNIKFEDLGNKEYDKNDDYPDFASLVSKKVSLNKESKGILICGSGIGMSIAANRFKAINAGLCLSPWMAEKGREDDDINILVLAADITDRKTAISIINNFISIEFSKKERHIRRLKKINQL